MEYMTHKAVVEWGPNAEMMTEEKKTEIEQAIKRLINALDRTAVESITFTNEDHANKENNQKEQGSAE